MGFILRTEQDLANPTLAGGVYGRYITKGMPVYWRSDGTSVRGIIFIGDGGRYGMDSIQSFEYKGRSLVPTTEFIFHRGTLSTGFGDSVQGLPTMCPEVDTTFNNIAYIEFTLPAVYGLLEPSWDDIRIVGIGRRLMDYNSSGTATGVTSDSDLLQNIALQIADNFIVNFGGKVSRIDWSSWSTLRTSAAVLIWQRSVPSDGSNLSTGLYGEYFADTSFSSLVGTRLDQNVDFSWGSGIPPFPGAPTANYSVRWTGKIQPKYSQTYTFSALHDDDFTLVIGGTTVISQTGTGTHTGTTALTANQVYSFVATLKNFTGPGDVHLSWSSTSQASEIIPTQRLYLPDVQVKRYAASIAFATPTEAADVHETLMLRAPGWDWSDRDGKIVFLSPSRSSVFTLRHNRLTPSVISSLIKESMQKRRRPMIDRKNFRLGRFRDILFTGYPFGFVQADRDNLRQFTSGIPTNDNADDLGVVNRSLANRMLEMAMIINSDPKHLIDARGGRKSSVIRKCDRVTINFIDVNGEVIANGDYMALFHSWGSLVDENAFQLLPIATWPFYTDEPV